MSPRLRAAGTSALHSTFASLEVPNYRRYIGGQSVSLIGTWMQMTAQSWLVLSLTHSATTLGVIVALQTLPVLLLTPYGGVIADRVDKRRLMIVLQAVMGVQALILGVLTVTGAVTVFEIGVLALLLGLNNAFENPSRQSFMLEMVGPEHLRNAVSLNSTLVNVARVVGPGIGGILIAVVGTGVCFLFNAASFAAVVYSLITLNPELLNPAKPAGRSKGQLREGFRYVRRTPGLLIPLAMMAVVGCLTYEFQVSLPYLAANGLHAGSSGYGFMTAAMGIGAVISGLVLASRGRTGVHLLTVAVFAFAIAMACATLAPDLGFELVAMALVGGASGVCLSVGNATLQMRADPAMRGRVMALWFVAFQGSTPIGSPIIGAVMSGFGARAGLGLGAITCCVVGVGAVLVVRTLRLTGVQVDPSPSASAADSAPGRGAPGDFRGTSAAPALPSVPRVRSSAPAARLGRLLHR
jgi:MFS family permease